MAARTVIIVSPYFAPSALAGIHRARHLAKHLPNYGWQPVVLCVDETYHEQRLDRALEKLIPASVEIVKTTAVPIEFSRRVGVGDIGLRAGLQLRQKLFQLLKVRRPAAVLISGSPYYPMLMTRSIKRQFRVPVVLDFQDPWVSRWGAAQRFTSKAGLSHHLGSLLEPIALREADYITSVSENQNEEMSARYPWLNSSRMAAIPIGGDPDDFALVRNGPEGNAYLDPSFINLSYVGTVWPAVEPSIRSLLRAFARIRSDASAGHRPIRLNFIGTNADPNDTTTLRVKGLAASLGVADSVNEIPARIPFMGALDVLSKSDGLLLIGSDEPHYTASKIYPSLMSDRPFLSLYHRDSSAHQILSSAGGGRALGFSNLQELKDIEATIAEGLQILARNPAALGSISKSSYKEYEANAIAGRFAEVFQQISASPTSERSRPGVTGLR